MVKTNTDIRQALRDWVVSASARVRPNELTDETPIIDLRIISSPQVIDLILFLEALTGEPIDVEKLRPGAFRNIDAIYRSFFER